jgi:hypothetical protein
VRPLRARRSGRHATFLVALLLLSCQPAALRNVVRRSPASARPAPTRALVVLVPGVTGSMLRDGHGRVVWGYGRNLIAPRDGGRRLALPLVEGSAHGRLEPFALLGSVRLLGLSKPVYGPLVRWLEEAGYRRAVDHRARRDGASAADSLLLFPWDWRQSHVAAAGRLAEALEAARRARGDAVLPVALVCQSSGAHVCRWFAKYGGATLEQVETGRAAAPSTVAVRALVLVGCSNGGSLRILRELDRGRRYVPAIGRTMLPETLFTFPSLYEDLPAYRSDLFVDERGRALDVDLYDATAWRRFGWSAFSVAASRRLSRPDAGRIFATGDARLEYLRSVLDRARRFQRALAADTGWPSAPRYHLIQGRSDPATPERAVIAGAVAAERTLTGGAAASPGAAAPQATRLLFAGDHAVDSDPRLRGLTAALGDGHATVESQHWLAPEEARALAGPAVSVPGEHFELILSREARAALLAALADLQR